MMDLGRELVVFTRLRKAVKGSYWVKYRRVFYMLRHSFPLLVLSRRKGEILS